MAAGTRQAMKAWKSFVVGRAFLPVDACHKGQSEPYRVGQECPTYDDLQAVRPESRKFIKGACRTTTGDRVDEPIHMYLMDIGKLPRLAADDERAAIADGAADPQAVPPGAPGQRAGIAGRRRATEAVCDGREPFYEVVECSVMIPLSGRRRIAKDISRRLSEVGRATRACQEPTLGSPPTVESARPERRAAWRRLLRRRRKAARLVESSSVRTECLLEPLRRLVELSRQVRQVLDDLAALPTTTNASRRRRLEDNWPTCSPRRGKLPRRWTAACRDARAQQGAGRGQARPAQRQSAAGSGDRQALLQSRRQFRRLASGGQPGLDAGRGEGGLLEPRRILLVCDILDPVGHPAGDRRAGRAYAPAGARDGGHRATGTATRRLSQDLKAAEPGATGRATGLSASRLVELIRLQQKPFRLACLADEEAATDDEIDIQALADFRWETRRRESSAQHLPASLEGAMAALSDRERKVLRLRFGLADGRRRTLREVGDSQSLTNERIRQIERDSLVRLRSSPAGKRLEDLL